MHLAKLFFMVIVVLINVIKISAQPLERNEDLRLATIDQARSIESIRSLLVQKDKDLIIEEYFRDATPDHPYNIKSASKSIISLLVGIAVDQGKIELNETLGDYFPEYFESSPDLEKEIITIRNLLSMQSGLETTSFYNYGAWVISDDWVEFQLDQPLEEEPGGKMVYSTGTSHLLSVIISKATGMSTKSFAEEFLFDPLNIQVGGWDKDPQGYFMGGNNLALTPEALLKIGQLMMNGGTWQNKEIISQTWIRDSFQSYTQSNFNPYDYGYMWWNRPVAGFDIFFAWGFGGQYIFIVPELNSVVVITSSLDNATQRRTYKEPIFDLLEAQIIPLLQNN